MSETHQHPVRYTVIMRDRHWWGGRITLHITGKASSQKDGELLIFLSDGGLYSINYTGVWMMTATPMAHEG